MTERALSRPLILLALLTVTIVLNAWFDVKVAPVAIRLARKAASQQVIGDPTYIPGEHPIQVRAYRWSQAVRFARISRWFFKARFVLTALPWLFVLFFALMRRLRETHLADAIVMACILLLAKVLFWEVLWMTADAFTMF
jgi:4-amino-4-deoxy-L-arabinose transferase-like glycosyltransferase